MAQKSPCIYCLLLLPFPVVHAKKRVNNCSGLPGLHELLHHVVSVTIQGDPRKIHGKLVSWSMVLSHGFCWDSPNGKCEKWWYFPMGFRAYFETDQPCSTMFNLWPPDLYLHLQHELSVASLKPASMCSNVCRLFLSKWIFHISFCYDTGWLTSEHG